MGPAVSDAASWYEESQMVGIIATPAMGIMIESLKKTLEVLKKQGKASKLFNEDLFYLIFKEYHVPLKSNETFKMWTINWPLFLYYNVDEDKEKTCMKFYSSLSSYPVPKGVENKYKNTIDYFESSIQEHDEKMGMVSEPNNKL